MSRLVALTRDVPPTLSDGERTRRESAPIDVDRAGRQHAAYEDALRALGCEVVRLTAPPGHPDAVFIEDTAVVLDEIAVVTRPGAPSRRGETAGIAEALAPHRPVTTLDPPARIDGGDVLAVGRIVFVGLSSRTDRAGVEALRAAIAPLDYEVRPIDVRGCLHLKSAATALGEDAVVVSPAWIDPDGLPRFHRVEVDPAEPGAANVLAIGARAIVSASWPRTRERIEAFGIDTVAVDVSELEKAEAGVTCGSLVFRTPIGRRSAV